MRVVSTRSPQPDRAHWRRVRRHHNFDHGRALSRGDRLQSKFAVLEATPSVLTAWESFYVIVGSSGAALTGLMFVVIALIADTGGRRTTNEIDAFGTPTIVHFCVALFMAAVVSAPWNLLRSVAITIATVGAVGIVYGGIVVRRARRQTGYRPVFEDWLWYSILPILAYAMFLGAGIALTRIPEGALFVIGAATLLLLLVGIHNAWDTVTYIALVENQLHEAASPQPSPPQPQSKPQPPSVAAGR